jgi:hypothetical protein
VGVLNLSDLGSCSIWVARGNDNLACSSPSSSHHALQQPPLISPYALAAYEWQPARPVNTQGGPESKRQLASEGGAHLHTALHAYLHGGDGREGARGGGRKVELGRPRARRSRSTPCAPGCRTAPPGSPLHRRGGTRRAPPRARRGGRRRSSRRGPARPRRIAARVPHHRLEPCRLHGLRNLLHVHKPPVVRAVDQHQPRLPLRHPARRSTTRGGNYKSQIMSP